MLTSGALTAALAAIFALGMSLTDTLGRSIVEDLRRVAPHGVAVSAEHPGILSAAYRESKTQGSRSEGNGRLDQSDEWSAHEFTAPSDDLSD